MVPISRMFANARVAPGADINKEADDHARVIYARFSPNTQRDSSIADQIEVCQRCIRMRLALNQCWGMGASVAKVSG